MAPTRDHRVTIERRGRSHRAVCGCGWRGHAWNELRPAEADAWHHLFGDRMIIDVAAIADERGIGAGTESTGCDWSVVRGAVAAANLPEGAGEAAVERLVRHARDLAGRPSPYSHDAANELWRAAERDPARLRGAVSEVEELLARHERQSSGAADSEWLELITAKRLLHRAMTHGEGAGSRWAMT